MSQRPNLEDDPYVQLYTVNTHTTRNTTRSHPGLKRNLKRLLLICHHGFKKLGHAIQNEKEILSGQNRLLMRIIENNIHLKRQHVHFSDIGGRENTFMNALGNN